MDTVQMLDKLAELRAALDLLALEKARLIEEATPPEIRTRLSEIGAEFTPKEQAAQAQASELETAIKQAVLQMGETVKGARLQAIWSNGRVTWDAKKLDGYAVAHPELAAFRRQGEPSVSIRTTR